MATALFINGIHERVLTDILDAQARGAACSYLQPHKRKAIRMLREHPPNPERPVRLYASTTRNLSRVEFTAEIIAWENKDVLSVARRRRVEQHLETYQLGELELFQGRERDGAINLLTIRNLRRLDSPESATALRKASDGQPLKPRTRAGGWSEVHDEGFGLPVHERIDLEGELLVGVARARSLTRPQLDSRLASAPRLPQRVQIISVGFRRNPDVIEATLRRANGLCEDCRQPAPFRRRSDGTPFLEVHHRQQLSDGGEDTLENAIALCPNCHRRAHFG